MLCYFISITLLSLSLSSFFKKSLTQSNALLSLPELTDIDLNTNQFTGAILNSLFNPTISTMFLQRNNFTHPSPPPRFKSSLPQGSFADLSHNSISGELPSTLAGAEALFLNNNRLTGDIPEEYVKSLINGTPKQLFLQHSSTG